MDFVTAAAPPFRITLNGTPYDLPRFLAPQFKAWVAIRQKQTIDLALAQLPDADARARFLMYFIAPPVDTAALMDEAATPDGAEYVNETCMAAGNVPEDVRKAFHANVDPMQQRNLSLMLCSSRQAAARQREESDDPGSKGNPLTGQPHTSGGSPATTSATSPSSAAPTPDATPTA